MILLPWAGLPFMLGLTIVALRRGGWREPALFAVVVALVSGINASSIIYVGVAPVLWIVYAVVVLRESTWRHALGATLRIGVLTLGACLWWMAGLEVEAAFGVNVLKYTETVPSTSQTSNVADIFRGLGYWYFYGSDHLGPWTTAAVRYTQDIWLLATSYAVPVLSLVAAAFVRWRERAFFLVLLFVGLILSVGPFPFSNPTLVGGWLKSFMTDTTAGLALRSTDRATPVVLLALCMLLGSGLSALWSRFHIGGFVTALLVAGLVVANNPSLFLGDFIANNFTQPAALPSYQLAAIKHLNATHPGTRVFAIPGNDFAAYRWGDTVDTPQPAFLDRDFVTREQQILGSIATADTLYATDGPLQDGTANLNALAPMSRLMGAGDLMVEYDQQYERYGVPQPQLLALQLLRTPLGLTDPMSFGVPRPNTSVVSTLNEQDLSVPGNVTWPSPIVTYTVPNPRPMVRGESDTGALVMEGDATGLNNLAGLGLLNTDSAVYYAGTLANQPSRLQGLASQGAQLVLTDTNRKEAFRWDTLTANSGFTETPSDNPAKTDLSDSPVELFPGTTIVEQVLRQLRRRRERHGEQLRQFGLVHARGPGLQRHRQQLRHGLDHGHLRARPQGQVVAVAVHQPGQHRPHHPGAAPTRRPLALGLEGDAHLRRQGPRHLRPRTPRRTSTIRPDADLPGQPSTPCRVTIDSTTNNTAPPPAASAVGFSEIEIPGQTVHQVVQMPTQMLASLGAASTADRLTVVMTRQRTSQFPPRSDPETTISRQFTLPTARTFTLAGSASLSALIPDDEVDRLVGRATTPASTVRDAYSSGRLPGDVNATASATVDGNPATAWQPGLGGKAQVGSTLTYDLAKPQTPDRARHAGDHRRPPFGPDGNDDHRRATRRAPSPLPPIADSTVPGAVTDRAGHLSRTHRLALRGHVHRRAPRVRGELLLRRAARAAAGHRGDRHPRREGQPDAGGAARQLRVQPADDRRPTDQRLRGRARRSRPSTVASPSWSRAGPTPRASPLRAGPHVVQSVAGHNPPCANTPTTCTGWNIDQLALDSAAGGGAGSDAFPTAAGTPQLQATQPGPAATVTSTAVHLVTTGRR